MRKTITMLAALALAVGMSGCPTKDAEPIQPTPPPTVLDDGAPTFSAGVTEVDEFAPDFTLTDTEGDPVTKDDYSGKVLVLDFWATWCKPCVKKLKLYEPIIDKYKGVELLAVTLDPSPEVAVGWAKQNDFAFPIAMFDDDFKAAYFPEATGQLLIPQMRIIDRDGNLRFKLDARSTVEDMELALADLVGEKVGGDESVSESVLPEGEGGAEADDGL